MCERTEESRPIDTIIYTVEAEASTKRAEDDKKVPDPNREQVLAVLQGGEKEAKNEGAKGGTK
jgi:hypothetical protein